MNYVSISRAQRKIADSIAGVTGKGGNATAKRFYDFSLTQGVAGMHACGVQAELLSNFGRIMDSAEGQMMMTTKDYGPYVMEVWPVVTAWYPDFPLKDLISVQSMDKPLAYLFFSRLITATDKAPTSVGNVVETALGMRQIKGQYPTGEIIGEEIPAAQIEFDAATKQTISLLAYPHLNTTADYLAKVKVTVTGGTLAGTYFAESISGGKIILKKGLNGTADSANYIDVETGAIYFAEASDATAKTITGLVVNYVWDLEYAHEDTIPTVKEDIEMLPMEAIPRAIAMKWSIFSEYLKKSQFGVDIREENTKRILNLLYQFQVRYILDSLYEYSTGTATVDNAPAADTITIAIPGSTTMSVEVKSQEVVRKLKQVATSIEIASGRMEGNRIVCGKNFKSFVESLPNTLFTPTAQPSGFSGPREIGKYGTFTVYYDQMRADNEAFMTYRGSEWYDAAYYLGEFMPITPTDAIALQVTVRESFLSMEAYKYHKPNCVVKLNFTNA